jgi:NADH dehydrogenase
VLAIPTWERKVRVLLVWASAVFFGRDIISLISVQHPRRAFLDGGRVTASHRGDQTSQTHAAGPASDSESGRDPARARVYEPSL